jgi:hypothetical protein
VLDQAIVEQVNGYREQHEVGGKQSLLGELVVLHQTGLHSGGVD